MSGSSYDAGYGNPFANMTTDNRIKREQAMGSAPPISGFAGSQQDYLMKLRGIDPDPEMPKPYTMALAGGGGIGPGALRGRFRMIAGIHPPSESGLLHTAGPGRTDNLYIHPLANSYVIPADVVSGIGEGNTLAGAKLLDGIFGGHGGAMAGTPRHAMPGFAAGGATPPPGFAGLAPGPRRPIVAAGGEYILSPEQVAAIGGGDHKAGLDELDKWVVHERGKIVKTMQKLKPPVKE